MYTFYNGVTSQVYFNLDLYFEFGYFHENFIIAKSVERHICDVKNSQLGHDLPISVSDRVIVRFSEDFISRNFANFRENKTLVKKSKLTVNTYEEVVLLWSWWWWSSSSSLVVW